MVNARSIQGTLILIASLFLAVWLGIAIVTNQAETLIRVSAAAVIIAAVFLGRKVWLLMILFTAANVVLLNGVGTVQIGQMLFLAMTAATFLMRKLRYQLRFGELEFWMLLIIACILQVYMRNPVGLNIFGGSTVGGKPYLFLILSISSSLLLSTLRVDPGELKWAYRLYLIGGFLGIGGTIARYGSASGGYEEQLDRIPALASVGQSMANWLSSRISPLRAALHPFWGVILLLSLAAAAGSAYRNAVAGIGLTYLFAIGYRGGSRSLVLAVLGGVVSLILLALVNLNFPLPGNIQRALSPLPGTWEKQYVETAQDSTDWRVEMWEEALFSDRWIHNKIIGDGIGMTAEQLAQNQMIAATQKGKTSYGLLAQQENMLINGSYHSGPVHSVRAVGYVGLIILLLAMIRVAVHTHRQIRRCRGTEWHPVALLFGIPTMVLPIFFVFVFGEYPSGVAATMLGFAMCRLIDRNVPLPACTPVQTATARPALDRPAGNPAGVKSRG